MKKRYFICALVLFALFFSCKDLIDDIKEKVTTAIARYIQKEAGGIEIKDFEGDVSPSKIGLKTPDGQEVTSFNFSEPKSDGIMSCDEVPVDFVKTSDEPGKRSVGPGKTNKYVGTWEGFIPFLDGFKRVFLDLKASGKCGIYLEFPQNAKNLQDIKTRVDTVIKGTCTKEQDSYKFSANMGDSKGYASAFARIVATLKIVEKELVAEFNVDGKANSIKLFKLDETKTQGNKKMYVGTEHFAKDKVEQEITLEIDENSHACTLTIPKDTKLPRNYHQ